MSSNNFDLRVLVIIDQYLNPNAGTENQVKMLVEGLLERHYQVEMGVFRSSDYCVKGYFPAPVTALKVASMSSPSSWWRLFRYLLAKRRQGFNVVQIFFNDAAVMVPPIAKLLGMKVIVCRRDMGFWYTPSLLKILKKVRYCVDAMVANSSAVAQEIKKREGFSDPASHVIYNGFIPFESAIEPAALSVQAALADKPVVAIVANVRPVKRVDDLVKACAKVIQRVPDLQLLVAGGGATQQLQQLAKELGISANVHCLGQLDNVLPVIQRADVMALTSESEGLSNAIMEYMAAAKPVVCSEVGGNPELVEHEHNGLLYPMGDIDKLAQALERLINDPQLAQQYGQAGRQKVLEQFSEDGMVQQHIELYKTLLGSSHVC